MSTEPEYLRDHLYQEYWEITNIILHLASFIWWFATNHAPNNGAEVTPAILARPTMLSFPQEIKALADGISSWQKLK